MRRGARLCAALTLFLAAAVRAGAAPAGLSQVSSKEELDACEELKRQLKRQEGLFDELSAALAASRIEPARLAETLSGPAPADPQEQTKLKLLLELQNRLQERLRQAQAQAKATRALKVQAEQRTFTGDWAAYQKLKAGGAAFPVLTETLRNLIDQYRGSGADLSEAYREFMDLEAAQ